MSGFTKGWILRCVGPSRCASQSRPECLQLGNAPWGVGQSLAFFVFPYAPIHMAKSWHVALPYDQMASFMAKLREGRSLEALALELTILCACRTGETVGARNRHG